MPVQFISGPLEDEGILYLSKLDTMSSATVNVLSIGSGNTITVEQSDDDDEYTLIEEITDKGRYTYDVTDYIYFRVSVTTYDEGLVWVEVDEGQAPLPVVPAPEVGLRLFKYDTEERDALDDPEQGLTIFNTETASIEVYDGEGWQTVAYVEAEEEPA
jgi:hypothetical protein